MKRDIAGWISATTIMSACFSLPSLRLRLLMGHKSYGPLLLSGSPLVAEMMATMGYGHIIVDHEHAATDMYSGQTMSQAIQAAHSLTMIVPNTNKNQAF
jgi:2-keto-3-deoxy-L-rhamnonate aldolase RhmA